MDPYFFVIMLGVTLAGIIWRQVRKNRQGTELPEKTPTILDSVKGDDGVWRVPGDTD